MARRRLSKRQLERIQSIQEKRRAKAAARAEAELETASSAPRRGIVITRHGAAADVADEDRTTHRCLLRQNLGHLVCGDHVIWQASGEDTGVITALLDRRTTLARPDFSGREKPLAANLTQIVIVVAPEPPPTGYLVDQYLVAAETVGVKALIVVNKSDLLSDTGNDLLSKMADYRSIGYAVIQASAKRKGGMDDFINRLRGETSILVGQSGVGKSSLVQALLPDLDIQTGELSDATGMGRHTTSAATLYFLREGGALIDSPGVRSFRLSIDDRGTLEKGFREFRRHLGRCQFSNCTHNGEPGCALNNAVQEGSVPSRRLDSFRQMAKELNSW